MKLSQKSATTLRSLIDNKDFLELLNEILEVRTARLQQRVCTDVRAEKFHSAAMTQGGIEELNSLMSDMVRTAAPKPGQK